MKKNILNLYEGFFDDLDKLNQNQNDGFGEVNSSIYDQHDFILSPDKNPEFFKGLCNMCEHYRISYNKNGFKQEDLSQITFIDSDSNSNCWSYFKNVVSLNELQYFNNLKTIEDYCFSSCLNLKSVIFPQNLEKIETDTFYNCVSLKELKIPNSLKEINKFAFYNCVSLEKIIIPKNIPSIRRYSFGYCTSLKEIIIPERFKDNMKYIFDKVDLTNVDITYI